MNDGRNAPPTFGENGRVTNVLMAGVGGQGIITASAVLAEAALIAGLDVKKSEVHGMSQRGGSVESHVRFSEHQVYSPLIPWNGADVVLGLELLETVRNAHWCRQSGAILVDERRVYPSSIATSGVEYPADCLERLRSRVSRIIEVPAFRLASELGEPRAANMVMLGALAEMIDIAAEAYDEAMAKAIKPKALGINREAFTLGRQQVSA